MAHAVRMPKPGQMTEECTLTTWFKVEGDPVHRGDILFEIETDKSAMEVESFEDGVLLRRLVGDGETVPVNTICAWIGAPGEEVPAGDPGSQAPAPAAPGPAVPGAAAVPVPPAAPAPAAVPAPAAAAARTPGAAGASAGTLHRRARIAVSPRASRLAAESGVDPRSIRGTGPQGRIVERDVRAAIGAGALTSAPSAPAAPATAGAIAVDGEEGPRPLSRMRRMIAERLTHSVTTIPHFTVTVAVDVTGLLELRSELKRRGTSLTVTDFVLAATAQSLADFPDVNSRTDGISVWTRRRVHLGVAVSLPAGLVVPVLRDADRLGIVALHERAAVLAAGARSGSLGVDDLTGSTFTVSNLGMFGVDEFSAIINPGESAILAVGSAVPTVVAIADGLAVRTVMKLTLSADHRQVDGELAARFLHAVRRRLEDPAAFRRELDNA